MKAAAFSFARGECADAASTNLATRPIVQRTRRPRVPASTALPARRSPAGRHCCAPLPVDRNARDPRSRLRMQPRHLRGILVGGVTRALERRRAARHTVCRADHPTLVVWSIRLTLRVDADQPEELRDVLRVHADAAVGHLHARRPPAGSCRGSGRRRPGWRAASCARRADCPDRAARPSAAGRRVPRARVRTDSGGYQFGLCSFVTMRVTPSGVFQSILAVLIGYVRTTRGSPARAGGK